MLKPMLTNPIWLSLQLHRPQADKNQNAGSTENTMTLLINTANTKRIFPPTTPGLPANSLCCAAGF
ncbi:hypothetical protein [Pseudomonas sp. MWU12-2115]|uniref:hypothetical protein n=1 Tax=Pseudomonas sp. MWU12-2115 TaxID=2071713 RepID=UPI0011BF101C